MCLAVTRVFPRLGDDVVVDPLILWPAFLGGALGHEHLLAPDHDLGWRLNRDKWFTHYIPETVIENSLNHSGRVVVGTRLCKGTFHLKPQHDGL